MLRENLPPLPARMKSLPVSDRGYPIPWFVPDLDGKPEFRAMDGRKWALAVEKHLCWVCGQPLGTRFAFVVGPMCGIRSEEHTSKLQSLRHLVCRLVLEKQN